MGIGAVISSRGTKGEANVPSHAATRAQPQTELRMPVGMDVPQVGFDQQVAKMGAGDLKGMRIDCFTGATQIMRKRLGRNPSARAQEFDLDTDAPQRAVCCKQRRRAERLRRDGNVVHHPKHGDDEG